MRSGESKVEEVSGSVEEEEEVWRPRGKRHSLGRVFSLMGLSPVMSLASPSVWAFCVMAGGLIFRLVPFN